MSLPMFNACVAGYQDRLFDFKLLAVQSGYWSGYYMSSKPKPLNSILSSLVEEYYGGTSKHADTVDVEAFLERERNFNAKLAQRK